MRHNPPSLTIDGTEKLPRLSAFYQLTRPADYGKIERCVMMRSHNCVERTEEGEEPRMLWISLIALMLLIAASPGIMLYIEHRRSVANHRDPARDSHPYHHDITSP